VRKRPLVTAPCSPAIFTDLGALLIQVGAAAAVVGAMGLCGCAGTVKSGRPIYPEDWPAIAEVAPGAKCPDLSGTFEALSDEAPPLVYAGQSPRKTILLVPYGGPVPMPMLGRRVLTWHLAGMRAELRGSSIKAGISYGEYQAQWGALTHFAALVEAAAAHPDGRAGNGLVKVREQDEGVIEVDAGLRDQTILSFRLKEYPRGAWWQTYQDASYQCRDGGLVIWSYFLPPDIENPAGLSESYSTATFYRAVDGSLVMLEESPAGIANAYTSPFQKWWRWQGRSE
jgi:hypothetical protein